MIEVQEPQLVVAGRLQRPFAAAAGIHCRGYSLPLQRRIVDFGAEVAFGQVPARLREHYGIEVPISAVQAITERHAARLQEQETLVTVASAQAGAPIVVAEVDGSMVPIVTTAVLAADRRKTRTVGWQEARLSLAHAQGSVSPVFAATLGTVDEAGDQLRHCAIQAGLGKPTRVHCVGDGAPWIVEQVHRVFGTQASYLVDFYHLCDYLAAAAPGCAPGQETGWLEEQKQRLRSGQVAAVLATLETHLEPTTTAGDTPVRACYRYLNHRLDQVDYARALAEQLPIGAGEIESAHRYVIQERLKLPGAWWQETHAQQMLALRTCRANQQWEGYWNQLAQIA